MKYNETSLFDMLPHIVQQKILVKLDHLSLILFGLIYPKYLNEVLKPVYWSFINTEIDEIVFKLDEIVQLAKYLNKSLKRLRLNLKNNEEDIDYSLNEILASCSNIKEFQFIGFKINFNFDTICSNLRNLTHLKLKFDNIKSDHLIQITNKFKSLRSFYVYSAQNVDFGLLYFLSNISRLEEFGMSVPSSTER